MGGEIGVDLAVVETMLRDRLGNGVVLENARQIRPWCVARCELGAGGTTSVIVKWLRSNQGRRALKRQMVTEVAALELVNASEPRLAPELLAFDLDRGFIVIEDLAPRRTLHSVLASGLDPIGEAGLDTFTSTMARLHAATVDRGADGSWDERARALVSSDVATSLLQRLDALAPVSAEVRAEVDAVLTEIEDPADLEALSNGDSGANNCLVDQRGRDGRLIDFEHACRRHVLLDVAALHVPGSMWMTVADPVPLGVDATYRQEVGDAIPSLRDDSRYGFGLAAACAIRALHRTERIDMLDQRQPGHESRPQLVTTIERAASTMEQWSQLPVLSAWLHDLAHALRSRWPDADIEFPNDYTLREPFEPDH